MSRTHTAKLEGCERAASSFVLCLLALAATCAQAHAQGGGTPVTDPLRRPVVYRLAAAERVTVKRDVAYKTAGATTLKMDVYYPPDIAGDARLPVVVFVNGVGAQNFKEWGQYTSWARLVAASGLVAVNYESRQTETAADTDDLIKYLRANASALKIDENKVAIWACSANVRTALPLVMQPERRYVRAAVFYYGIMNEQPTRRDVPLFVARAGFDSLQLNDSIDLFVKRAVDEEVEVNFVNYAEGQHGFELFDDTERSREIVRQTLDFITTNVRRESSAVAVAGRAPSPARFHAMIVREGFPAALRAYEQARRTNPEALLFREQSLNAVGYRLLQDSKTKEAVEVFKLNVAAYPRSANVYDSLADAYEAGGERELAIQFAEKTLAALDADASLNEAQKNNIRQSAQEKLKRLKAQPPAAGVQQR
jgi:acetyl esterase/lipase